MGVMSLMNELHPKADGEFDLLELLEKPFATKWAPRTEGDTLTGTVIHVRDEQWYGNPTPVFYLQTPAGHHFKIVASGVVLRRQMEELEVVEDDLIRVRYDGEADSQNYPGKKFKKYLVTKDVQL